MVEGFGVFPFFGTGWNRAYFQQERLPRYGVSIEAQFFRRTGGIPLGPQVL